MGAGETPFGATFSNNLSTVKVSHSHPLFNWPARNEMAANLRRRTKEEEKLEVGSEGIKRRLYFGKTIHSFSQIASERALLLASVSFA